MKHSKGVLLAMISDIQDRIDGCRHTLDEDTPLDAKWEGWIIKCYETQLEGNKEYQAPTERCCGFGGEIDE